MRFREIIRAIHIYETTKKETDEHTASDTQFADCKRYTNQALNAMLPKITGVNGDVEMFLGPVRWLLIFNIF